ncbi:serine/threonine protein kinase [Byssothecium circinans]|uniref:Serine/threonine protein kinase n=1 Tax=Byssothecium circinans TaxID=147558 RepID=A0A6A5TPG1_9PLEO|nr:serine/threonine protein kinase [Byssothecium circinans]
MATQDAATNVGFHQRDHDLLSLLSIFICSHQTVTAGLLLIGVLISDQNFDLPPPINQGAYFEVYSIASRSLTETRSPPSYSEVPGKALPEVVAVKCPKITGELRDKRNQKLWSSMAMELQILRHPDIQDHENIVTVLGVCWRSVRGQVMPAFVMEVAHTNLQAMMESEGFTIDKMSTHKTFGLAIDVCAGVSALHEVGIIHGDIKPANVLIFKDPELKFVAKISDFGSSLLKTDVKEPIRLPFSSGIWQAPECKKALDGEQLIAADTFALALLVAHMLSRGYMMAMFGDGGSNKLSEHPGQSGPPEQHEQSEQSEDDIEGRYRKAAGCAYYTLKSILRSALKAEENKRYGPAAKQQLDGMTNGHGENGEVDDDTDNDSQLKTIAQIARAVGETISSHLFEPAVKRRSGVLHRNIRICLSWVLNRDILNPLNYSDHARMGEFIKARDLNSQEQEILQNPANQTPTEEDVARVWHYAKMTEYIDRSIYAISQQRDLPGLDEIPQIESAHRIARILKNWKKHELPTPEEMYPIRNAGAVVEADRSLGTLRLLPTSVLNQIVTEMTVVAHDGREDKLRRAEAAWQCSILRFRLRKMEKSKEEELNSILQAVLLAARLGHTVAGGMVGWLHAAFDRSLPVSTKEEKQWLYAAICKGNSTARRRLSFLDMGEYQRAVSHLRCRYVGIGLVAPRNYYDSDLVDDDSFFMAIEDSLSSLGDIFQLAATGGRYELVRRIIASKAQELDINKLYMGNETVLLKACRSGHAEIALLLLDKGADPTLANDEGVTPLHFLGSFDEEDIPKITDALIQAGADREARSRKGWQYSQCIDSTYGTVEGTPLTWAVAAGNETATQALMDIGADPFDVQGRDIKYDDNWSNSVHVFPVWQASVTCQYWLLEILLEASKDYAEHLNGVYRKFGSDALKDPFAILGWVVTDGNSSTFNRILIHGKDYEKAFQKTFEVLIRHGANPLDINGEGESVIVPALERSQPYILDYLMSWQSGKLQPDPSQWIRCLWIACVLQDKVAFESLVSYSQADKVSSEQWNSFFAATYALPDDTEFLDHLGHYRRSDANFHDHFERALVAGKYVLAHWIYETGKCDLTKTTDGDTILGRLIMSSKSYSNSSRHIDALLDMNITDAVYYDVIHLEGSKMFALHAAVFMVEYRPGSSRSTSPLQSIVRRRYNPGYLNLVISEGVYKGSTALHLAVKTCNEEAVRYLLDEEGDSLDLALLDHEGNSLIDLASRLFKNQAPHMELWEVPEEKRNEADKRHFEGSLLILHMLYATNRVQPRKIMASVTKIEVDELFVLLYEPEGFKILKVELSVFNGLSPAQITRLGAGYSLKARWDLTLIWPQIVEHGPTLPLNSSFFLFKTDEMSAKEIESISSIGNIIRREQYRGDPNSEQSDMLIAMQNLMLQINSTGAARTE